MPSYTTRATVKEYLGIPTATATEDDAIDAAVDAAEAQIDEYCGRSFAASVSPTARTYYPVDHRTVICDDIGTKTGLVVKEDSGDDGTFETTLTIDVGFFLVGNLAPWTKIIRLDRNWPRPVSGRPSVEVTAAWTFDDSAVPAQVTQAATILGARLYQRRSSPLGFQAGLTPEGGSMRISRVDPDLVGLLSGLRVLATA